LPCPPLSLSLSRLSLSRNRQTRALLILPILPILPILSTPSSPRHPLLRSTNHHITPYHIPPNQIPPYRCQCKSLVTTAPETTGNHEKPPDRKTAKAGYRSKPPETAERHSHWIDLTCLQRNDRCLCLCVYRCSDRRTSHVARPPPAPPAPHHFSPVLLLCVFPPSTGTRTGTGPTGSTPLPTSPPSAVCSPSLPFPVALLPCCVERFAYIRLDSNKSMHMVHSSRANQRLV